MFGFVAFALLAYYAKKQVPTPVCLNAEQLQNEIALSWETKGFGQVDGYEIFCNHINGKKVDIGFFKVGTVKNERNITIQGMSESGSYGFIVRAYRSLDSGQILYGEFSEVATVEYTFSKSS